MDICPLCQYVLTKKSTPLLANAPTIPFGSSLMRNATELTCKKCFKIALMFDDNTIFYYRLTYRDQYNQQFMLKADQSEDYTSITKFYNQISSSGTIVLTTSFVPILKIDSYYQEGKIILKRLYSLKAFS